MRSPAHLASILPAYEAFGTPQVCDANENRTDRRPLYSAREWGQWDRFPSTTRSGLRSRPVANANGDRNFRSPVMAPSRRERFLALDGQTDLQPTPGVANSFRIQFSTQFRQRFTAMR